MVKFSIYLNRVVFVMVHPEDTFLLQEGQLSVSGERMFIILVNSLIHD